MSKTSPVRIVAFVLLTGMCVSEATAQSVMALGPVVASQLRASRDCRLACGLPASASGASFSFDRWVTPRVGIGAELTVGAVLRGRQQIRVLGGHHESETTHQDMIFAGTAQWLVRSVDTSINGVLGGGLGIAARQTNRTGPFRAVDGTIDAWTGSVTALTPSLVGGFDLPLRVYRYVYFVPSVRLHYLFDSDGSRQYPQRGVDNVLINVGGKVAIQF